MLFCCNLLSAQISQPIPRLAKTPIGKTGCYAYLPDSKTERKFELTYSPDSAKVYTGDFKEGDFNFAVILVVLNAKLSTYQEKEDMLIGYLDYLQTTFGVVNATGYGKGHLLASSPNATGILDYWEDGDGNKWAVKAWADENKLGVMMLYGPKEYPYFNVQQMFLDGFRF